MKTFDDVLIAPRFSDIGSRQDVDLSTKIGNTTLKFPVLSANMDTVTGPEMAVAMAAYGGLGVLHRFCSIEQSMQDYNQVTRYSAFPCAVSVGISEEELNRALALYEEGCRLFVIDVAHGAQQKVVDSYNILRKKTENSTIIVGNFATPESIGQFISRCDIPPDALKIGIGPGSACTTRIKTGVGVPQLDAIRACNKIYNGLDIAIIADGGLRTPGDIAKALAAGASAVMVGGMLAGTKETPGVVLDGNVKQYRGSASKSSYHTQGKTSGYRTAEGAEFYVDYKGPVENVLNDINGGLRSAFTYVGARNLIEFQEKAQFIEVTGASVRESIAHGDDNGPRR